LGDPFRALFPLLVIRGSGGQDLTLPCSAPPYLNRPLLQWSFSNGLDSSPILAFDSRSGASVAAPPPWGDHVELDGFRVPFGDGSLRLMDPEPAEHTGSYTCVFSLPRNTHTERSHVAIDDPIGEVARQRGLAAVVWDFRGGSRSRSSAL